VNDTAVSCTPVSNGTFTIQLVARDLLGVSVSTPILDYAVYRDPTVDQLIATPSQGVDVGQTGFFRVLVSLGTGTYSYSWQGLPDGCFSSDSPVVTCIPMVNGAFSIEVAVTDSNGFEVTSDVLPFTVYSDPTVSVPTANPSSLLIFGLTTMNVTEAGGSGGIQYRWSGLPSGCRSFDAPAISCSPTRAGTFEVVVHATDSDNFSVVSLPLTLVVYLYEVNITLAVTGTPGECLNMTLIDNGTPVIWGSLVRTHGGPSVLTLTGIGLQANHSYALQVSYSTSNGSTRSGGANPANLSIGYSGAATGRIVASHTFVVTNPSTHFWEVYLAPPSIFIIGTDGKL
ncbi:MAG: hypothetical protein JRN38_04450, partial [Nitrososphaerota archaeon]|nr:hypothetical protein [Nitrososphaerota archaeon]